MRCSFSAKSAASTPPASARMLTSASRASYSPERSVRTSISSSAFLTAVSSDSASARVSGSSSSSAISKSTERSSIRPRRASALRTSAWRWDSLLVIFCAASGSSHRDGAAACSSSTAMSALSLSRSRTASIDSMVEERDLSSSDTSTTATPSSLTARGNRPPAVRRPGVGGGAPARAQGVAGAGVLRCPAAARPRRRPTWPPAADADRRDQATARRPQPSHRLRRRWPPGAGPSPAGARPRPAGHGPCPGRRRPARPAPAPASTCGCRGWSRPASRPAPAAPRPAAGRRGPAGRGRPGSSSTAPRPSSCGSVVRLVHVQRRHPGEQRQQLPQPGRQLGGAQPGGRRLRQALDDQLPQLVGDAGQRDDRLRDVAAQDGARVAAAERREARPAARTGRSRARRCRRTRAAAGPRRSPGPGSPACR